MRELAEDLFCDLLPVAPLTEIDHQPLNASGAAYLISAREHFEQYSGDSPVNPERQSHDFGMYKALVMGSYDGFQGR